MKNRPKSNRGKRKQGRSRFSAWLHSTKAKCALAVLLGSMMLLAMFCASCAPQRYNLKVGAISHQTITATKDVVDVVTTEERRKAAANAVEPTYHLQEGAADEVVTHLKQVFDELRSVQLYGLMLRTPEDTEETLRYRTYTDSEIANAQALVASITLSRYQITTLLRTESADFENMVTNVTIAVENAMNTSVREGQVNQAIDTIRQIVGYSGVNLTLMQNIVPTVLRTCVKPNMVIEQQATEEARQKAVDAVENVVYLQGQNIIREGEIVRTYQYEMLKSLGLLENAAYDWNIYLGALLMVCVSMLVLIVMLVLLDKQVLNDLRRTCVLMLVLVVNLSLCVGVSKLLNLYVAPVGMAAMLLTALLGWQSGVAGATCMAMFMGGLAASGNTATSAEMVQILLMGLVSGIASVLFLRGKPQRMRMVLCGLLTAVLNLLSMLTVAMMSSFDQTNLTSTISWAMAGAVLSGVTALGLQPVFEAAFNLATPSKLMELANPNQPLLRRLLIEAPGTYHHSIIVANLAEAAAEKIGANPLLARTGAYFHDIGKLKRPMYFKENQIGAENPHDMTDPYVSAAILTSHTRDGLLLAQKHRLPPEIQQIIVEHHGDTPVMFFYHKALQQANGKPVDINDFRYDGHRPTTREAAIVMLADTTEAAVRSMSDPTPQSIEQFIARLVRGKLEDDQLSNAPLTLKDIDDICSAFCTVLNGVFHERIEYPTTDMPPRDMNFIQKSNEKDATKAPEKVDETVAQEDDHDSSVEH